MGERTLNSIEAQRDKFQTQLKRRQIVGSHKIATHTVKLLRKMVERAKWKTAAELMTKVKSFSRSIASLSPLVIENIVRHVLWIIREEFKELEKEEAGTDSDSVNRPRE